MFPVRPLTASTNLYTSVQPRISQALPKSADRIVRSLGPAGVAASRRLSGSIGSRGGLKAGSFVTLICAAGIVPARAFAANMSEAKTATFAAVWATFLPLCDKYSIFDVQIGLLLLSRSSSLSPARCTKADLLLRRCTYFLADYRF